MSALRPLVSPRHTEPTGGVDPAQVRLYGAIDVALDRADVWRRHPLTGFTVSLDHWSVLPEGDPAVGDIKDLWEIGRLTWLGRFLAGAATDPSLAEACWRFIESFVEANPPYRGPQWMCGQESALRGIMVAAMVSALRDSPATTASRMAGAARFLAVTVGRVRPTLGYALSQRNNHAISEAAFLWTATHLVDDLPDSAALRNAAAAALEDAIGDQWYGDGAHAQHSPTYQRLALHGLLWVSAVARSARVTPPVGVDQAIDRSAVFLARITDSASGAVPNMGGNDGALLFDLSGSPLGDFRPVVAHAAAAGGRPSPFEAGPWDDEARWFGLEPSAFETRPLSDTEGVSHHVHVGNGTRTVLRAGALRHRPAHADQLHVDIWIGSVNVASDPGSYRYTAPAPWSNALAGEAVHNLPRLPGCPQAHRRGRFFWVRWVDAEVLAKVRSDALDATLAELRLPNGARLRRLVVRTGDCHGVFDEAPPGAIVRWNLPFGSALSLGLAATTANGTGWHARFEHGAGPRRLEPAEGDPASGWRSPTYAVLEPAACIELPVDDEGRCGAWFAPADRQLDLSIDWTALQASSNADLRRLLAR